jgi:hypothetical protein
MLDAHVQSVHCDDFSFYPSSGSTLYGLCDLRRVQGTGQMLHRLRGREDARRLGAQADASALASAIMAPPVRARGGPQPQASRE